MRGRDDDTCCFFFQENGERGSNQLVGLMREIKQHLGKSNSQFASALYIYTVDLSDKEVSQYLNGSKLVSEWKLQRIAQAAQRLGVDGVNVRDILSRGDMFLPTDKNIIIREDFHDGAKQIRRIEKAALDNFEIALSELVSMGWSDVEVRALADFFIKKHIRPEMRTDGAAIFQDVLKKMIAESNDDVNLATTDQFAGTERS